jgi:hypothetical protein
MGRHFLGDTQQLHNFTDGGKRRRTASLFDLPPLSHRPAQPRMCFPGGISNQLMGIGADVVHCRKCMRRCGCPTVCKIVIICVAPVIAELLRRNRSTASRFCVELDDASRYMVDVMPVVATRTRARRSATVLAVTSRALPFFTTPRPQPRFSHVTSVVFRTGAIMLAFVVTFPAQTRCCRPWRSKFAFRYVCCVFRYGYGLL